MLNIIHKYNYNVDNIQQYTIPALTYQHLMSI